MSENSRPYVILCNLDDNIVGGDADDALAAQDAVGTAEAVRSALASLGPVELVETRDADPEQLSRALKRLQPRAVFNLVEGARGVAELEACVAGLLELLDIPYTGNTPQTLSLCLDKSKTKALLRGNGLPVPDGVVLRDAWRDSMDGLAYPVIVKPAALDASHGISADSVQGDEQGARAKAAQLIARFPPAAVVERFIDGREINVSVAQFEAGGTPTVLPLSEVDWHLAPGPHIWTFDAKWIEEAPSFRNTSVICPAAVSTALDGRIREICVAAFEAVSGRDYMRLDLRVDAEERVYILELNPNPSLSREAGFAHAAEIAGWSYDRLMARLIGNAEARGNGASARVKTP